jgi:hypothetical protein
LKLELTNLRLKTGLDQSSSASPQAELPAKPEFYSHPVQITKSQLGKLPGSFGTSGKFGLTNHKKRELLSIKKKELY